MDPYLENGGGKKEKDGHRPHIKLAPKKVRSLTPQPPKRSEKWG